MKMLAFVLMAAPIVAQAACDPAGTYLRGSRGPHETSFEIQQVGGDLELRLSTYGQKMPDGNWTTGAVRGRVLLSENGCVGAYLAPQEECSIFFAFRADRAEVHQFGSCLFGASAGAGGTYRRLRGQQGLTGRSSGAPMASADLQR